MLTLALVAFLLAASIGCSVPAASSREDESPDGFVPNALPVVDPGIEDVANRHLPAVKILMEVPDALGRIHRWSCSGALVRPGVAVTAAHCFCAPRAPTPADANPPAKATKSKRRKRKAVKTRAGVLQDVVISDIVDSRSSCTQIATVWTSIFITPGKGPLPNQYAGTVLLHPDFEMIYGARHGEKTRLVWDDADFAVVLLPNPVLLDFQPLIPSDTEANIGDALAIVGYSNNGDDPQDSTVRLFGDNEVTEKLEYDTGEVILGAAVLPGPEYPAPVHIRKSDSGGPCVRKEKRNVLLGIAIAEGTTADGRGISYFTSITRYKAWLSEIIRRFESRSLAGSSSPPVP